MPEITNRSPKTIHVVDNNGKVHEIPANATVYVPEEVAEKLALSPIVDGVPPMITTLKEDAGVADDEVAESTGDESTEEPDEVEEDAPDEDEGTEEYVVEEIDVDDSQADESTE